MTFVVPFDGSDLAEAALVRAVEFSTVLEERVVAVSVVPERNERYAREKGWLGPDEPFDRDHVVSTLHEQVTDLAPSVDFTHAFVDRFAPPGTISAAIRRRLVELDASMVFVGSENAGHLVTSLTSVGSSVAADEAYDVVIIRHRRPAKVQRLRRDSPFRKEKSDFYVT